MKKTIAKIMAAAMVLSTVAAPNVLAQNTKDTITGITGDATVFQKDAEYSLDGVSKSVNSNWDGEYGAVSYAEAQEGIQSTKITETQMADLIAGNGDALSGSSIITGGESLTFGYTGDPDNGVLDSKKNAVTAVEAESNNYETTTDEDIIDKILSDRMFDKTTVYGNDEFKDVVQNDLGSRSCVKWRVNRNTGRAWPFFDFSVTGTASIVRQLNAGNAILLPMTVQVQRGGVWRSTRRTRWRWFWNINTVNANDDYWNAIVKLKADRNRYTPIRVHVDVQEGSLDGINGLFVQIVNGTVVNVVDNGVIGTRNIIDTTWMNNKLQIMDVQDDDLALLKSDIAKGKNLMLDEAYLFDVTDALNNNSYSAAGPGYIDFDVLGQNIDLGTASIGKITDIRSRLFKDCKEKLVHAKNVKFIRNGAFRKNKQLKKAILSDDTSMKRINEKAFYDCKKLNTVKVKVNTLKQVGKNAFGGSTDKKGLKFNLKCGNKTQYNKAVKLFKKSGVKKAKFRKI